MAHLLRSFSFAALVLVADSALGGHREAQIPQLAHGKHRKHGKLFFMFMADDKMHHPELWRDFFSYARRGDDYEVLVHCQNESACQQAWWDIEFQPMLLPQTASVYCEDLVGPMVTLLDFALRLPASPNWWLDKFIFVSDTTLPIKPFWDITSLFTRDSSSRFCMMPAKVILETHETLPKASQWSTLSRKHSKMLVEQRARYTNFTEEWVPFMKERANGTTDAVCSDEFWFFYTIFGKLNTKGCPLNENGECEWEFVHADHLTKACDTYVHWWGNVTVPKGEPTGGDFLHDVHDRKLPAQMETHTKGKFGPGWIVNLTAESLLEWRKSSYVFMRKVEPHVNYIGSTKETILRDAFARHVLE